MNTEMISQAECMAECMNGQPLRGMDRLEWILAGLHAGRNDAARLADELTDSDLCLDIGIELVAMKRALDAIDRLLATYAAATAPLPAGIEEV